MEWIKISEKWPPANYTHFLYYDGEDIFVAYLVDENHELKAAIIQCHWCHQDAEPECQCGGPRFFVKPTDYWAELDYPKDLKEK